VDESVTLEALHIPAWTYLLLAAAIFLLMTMTLDNGTVLRSWAHVLHEFVHDGRHILGVPCH
jgi:hypothetical protein